MHVDRLAPKPSVQPCTFDAHLKTPKHKAPNSHLIDDRVEPFDEQQLQVGGLARDLNALQRLYLRIGDHGRHGQCGLLEGLGRRRAAPAHTDVGIVREVLPFLCWSWSWNRNLHARNPSGFMHFLREMITQPTDPGAGRGETPSQGPPQPQPAARGVTRAKLRRGAALLVDRTPTASALRLLDLDLALGLDGFRLLGGRHRQHALVELGFDL